MKAEDAVKMLKLCARAESFWRAAALCWERFQDSEHADFVRCQGEAEEIMRTLSPRITCDYPGLYPAFKVDGKDCYSLSGAYGDTLIEKDRRVLLSVRALRECVKRGAKISLAHFGDRERVKLLTIAQHDGKPYLSDLTWHVARAFGYRYSDRTRSVSIYQPDSFVVDTLARVLFGDTSALKAEWL